MGSQDLARTFTDCELYFPSPTQFSDPFDCNPPFSTDYSEDDLRCHFRKAIPATLSKFGVKLSDAQLEAMTEKRVASILKNASFESDIVKPFLEGCVAVNSELGVLCLSEVYNDILMWSHYADGHRGIVLEFDKSELESVPDYRYCKKVDYDKDILTLDEVNRADPNELSRLLLLKKARRWKYEEEWRIIVEPSRRQDFPNCRIFKFPKRVLTGVIFGCKMSPDDKYAVHTWLKAGNHQARIYEAIRETNSYSLKIHPPL